MKKAQGSFDRAVPLQVTLERAMALCERYGVTRVGEITHLDRIGIPVTTAIVPNSRDLIGVYNGKGITRAHALVSGVMEALERQICARCDVPRFSRTYASLANDWDLPALGWIAATEGDVTCVAGTDVLSGAEIAVPIGLVQCPREGPQCFAMASTNGLASGNNAEEAIYHALFEVCERHLWSRVHVLAHAWPRSLRVRAGNDADVPDDPVATEVSVERHDPLLQDAIVRIERAGLRFRLLCYAPQGWPIAMLACIAEPGADLPYHLGMGCSWSPRHAALRAITEAAQVRAADMAGAREDLTLHDPDARGAQRYGMRPSGAPTGRWFYDGPALHVALASLEDRSHDDLAVETRMLLDLLRTCGERRVAYVDLSPADAPISVARVIVPTLERTLVDGTLSRNLAALLTPAAGLPIE